MNDKPLYCCFSVPLRDFLMEHGQHYEICAANPNTGKLFWVFLRTPRLMELLAQWSN